MHVIHVFNFVKLCLDKPYIIIKVGKHNDQVDQSF